MCLFFLQAEDGIRDLVRSRGLGDVYKRQVLEDGVPQELSAFEFAELLPMALGLVIDGSGSMDKSMPLVKQAATEFVSNLIGEKDKGCLLYTSDAADERSSVDLGGRRIIKKKKTETKRGTVILNKQGKKSNKQKT